MERLVARKHVNEVAEVANLLGFVLLGFVGLVVARFELDG
jgi:hypothetical protein